MRANKLRELINTGDIDGIRIISNEGDIYTAEALVGNQVHTLNRQDSGQAWVFRSYIEAKRALKTYQVPLMLETSHVYEEMVGPSGETALSNHI